MKYEATVLALAMVAIAGKLERKEAGVRQAKAFAYFV
jgi:hypothetical protein